jgi:hypothetical protein
VISIGMLGVSWNASHGYLIKSKYHFGIILKRQIWVVCKFTGEVLRKYEEWNSNDYNKVIPKLGCRPKLCFPLHMSNSPLLFPSRVINAIHNAFGVCRKICLSAIKIPWACSSQLLNVIASLFLFVSIKKNVFDASR